MPPPTLPPPTPSPDTLSSPASQPAVLSIYLLFSLGFGTVIAGGVLRKRNASKYERAPDEWLLLPMGKSVLSRHMWSGMVAVGDHDAVQRAGKGLLLVISMETTLLLTTILPLIQPTSYASSSDTGLGVGGRASDALFPAAASLVFSTVIGLPILRRGLERRDEGRFWAYVFGLMVALGLAIASALALLLPLWIPSLPHRASIVFWLWSYSLLVDALVFQPIWLVLSFWLLGIAAIRQIPASYTPKVAPLTQSMSSSVVSDSL